MSANRTPAAGTPARAAFDAAQSQRLDRVIALIDEANEMPDSDDKRCLLEVGRIVKGRVEREAMG